jgi:hypothetical protein
LERVVLCDGTGADGQLQVIVPLFSEHGIEVEVLGFDQGRDSVVEFGKGYGEATIIRYALKNSEFLREAGGFFKVTGRVFVPGFDRLAEAVHARVPTFMLDLGPVRRAAIRGAQHLVAPQMWNSRGARLQKWLNPGVSTVFWHAPKDYFIRHLLPAYLSARDRDGRFVELTLLPPLIQNGVKRFSAPVELVGESGSNDACYSGGSLEPRALAVADFLLSSLE